MDSQANFSSTQFFSNTEILNGFFEKAQYAWEVLPQIEEFIRTFKDNPESKNYTEISENIFIGHNVVIDDTAKIKGVAIIGDNSIIGHAAFLRGGVIVGKNVNVGHATEVKHSIIMSNAALAHLNYIGDSIVGASCNISGGATLANWRFDKKEIEIKNGDSRIPTGMDKFGAIVGDGCFVGVSAVLNPGTVLGKECLVFPLVSVSGTYPESSKIK